MTDTTYFGIRPYPAASEGFEGYMLRLMFLNGLQDLGDMAKVLRMPRARLRGFGRLAQTVMQECAAKLSQMLKRDPDALDEISGRQQVRWIFDQHRMIQDLRLDFPRVCPCCIDEKQTMDWRWGLAITSTCSEHEVQLMDTCAHCEQPLEWDSRLFSGCPSCGTAWKQQAKQSKMAALERSIYSQLESNQLSAGTLELLTGAIIVIARPLDAMHQSLQVVPRVSALGELVSQAYMLIERDDFRKSWCEFRASKSQIGSGAILSNQVQRALSALALPCIIDDSGTEDRMTDQWVEYPEFVRPARSKCCADKVEALNFQVSYQELAEALGLPPRDIKPLVDAGVVAPMNSTNILRDQLFDLREIDEKMQMARSRPDAVCDVSVSVDSPLLEQHMTSYGHLLASCLTGKVLHFRFKGIGYRELEVNSEELADWLALEFQNACADPISTAQAQKVLSCGPKKLRSLIASGAFTWARWSASADRIDGESFHTYVLNQRLQTTLHPKPEEAQHGPFS